MHCHDEIGKTGAALNQMFTRFSFYLYAAHGDLPSFPTRRSSDLITIPPTPGNGARQLRTTNGPAALRSEEHTSELQSRRDLVCRLLLEKKKLIAHATALLAVAERAN